MATDSQQPLHVIHSDDGEQPLPPIETGPDGFVLTEEAIRRGREISPEMLQSFVDSLKDLPQVTFTVNFATGKATTERALFVETWAPTAAEDRARFLDQLKVMIAEEHRHAGHEMQEAIGALVIGLGDRQQRGEEMARLLSESLGLLERTAASFAEVLVIAARLDDPELRAWAATAMAEFHVVEVDEDDEPSTEDGPGDGS